MFVKARPSKFAISTVTDTKLLFDLFMPPSIKSIIVEMGNIKGLELLGQSRYDTVGCLPRIESNISVI